MAVGCLHSEPFSSVLSDDFVFCICMAQSVTCLATDACLTAIPGVASSILARSHTFLEMIMK